MDVKKSILDTKLVFEEAHKKGLRIIAAIKSKEILRGLGFGTKSYFSSSNWIEKWKMYVQKAQKELEPYVDIWQIDNELNHPWHNPIPSLNFDLAQDILRIGANVVKNKSPKTKVAVNLFYKMRSPLPVPFITYPSDASLIRKLKEQLVDKIDILGMDIYRGTWHLGKPADYLKDLEYYHDLWGGDVMIMETGYCTGFLRSEVQQAQYVKNVFNSLDGFIRNTPWFKGIMWYEFHSKHSGFPCEEFFGLHEKAWKEFVQNAKRYEPYNKMIGITYHY
jgi:hypothetical protein